ncbi:FHA domain-containing protein [Nocardia farcinica]|uniref:FHA domain-containing protein n=1 Tax=Nocardia farcinica TaxID=37329 RepID=UPI00245419D8|nr:FHA domain-containing protein [Nocardia farcinica]
MGKSPSTVGIAPGEGLIARFGAALVYLAESDSGERILDAVEAESDGAHPGAAIARRLAGVVFGGGAEPPAFGVVAPTEDGTVILLRGPVRARIHGAEGARDLSGARAFTWVDEIVREPVRRILVGRDTGAWPAVHPHTDLRAGIVPGAAFELRVGVRRTDPVTPASGAATPAPGAAPALPRPDSPATGRPVAAGAVSTGDRASGIAGAPGLPVRRPGASANWRAAALRPGVSGFERVGSAAVPAAGDPEPNSPAPTAEAPATSDGTPAESRDGRSTATPRIPATTGSARGASPTTPAEPGATTPPTSGMSTAAASTAGTNLSGTGGDSGAHATTDTSAAAHTDNGTAAGNGNGGNDGNDAGNDGNDGNDAGNDNGNGNGNGNDAAGTSTGTRPGTSDDNGAGTSTNTSSTSAGSTGTGTATSAGSTSPSPSPSSASTGGRTADTADDHRTPATTGSDNATGGTLGTAPDTAEAPRDTALGERPTVTGRPDITTGTTPPTAPAPDGPPHGVPLGQGSTHPDRPGHATRPTPALTTDAPGSGTRPADVAQADSPSAPSSGPTAAGTPGTADRTNTPGGTADSTAGAGPRPAPVPDRPAPTSSEAARTRYPAPTAARTQAQPALPGAAGNTGSAQRPATGQATTADRPTPAEPGPTVFLGPGDRPGPEPSAPDNPSTADLPATAPAGFDALSEDTDRPEDAPKPATKVMPLAWSEVEEPARPAPFAPQPDRWGRVVPLRPQSAAEPPGALIFEDVIYPLDRAYVVGRNPSGDEAVRNGLAAPLTLPRDRHVSRVHAHVTLDGGRVLVRDAGTPAGTFLAGPGSDQWTRVGSSPVELPPGWRLRIGQKILTHRPATRPLAAFPRRY